MSKTFWAIIAVIIVIFGGIVLFSKDDSQQSSGNAKPTEHISGLADSKVTLLEYADYQCPFCAQYYPLVKQVTEEYKDKVRFQYRNLPLSQIHKHAYAAARAAEVADKQGKFWEMYDMIYQNQSAWSESENAQTIFEQYAKQLGLNVEQYKKDAASEAVNDSINADINEYKKTKEAMSTPTFFLNGKKVQPKSVDEFKTLLDAALAEAEKEASKNSSDAN